ncbi:AI-2E family transporter [Herbiconiux sp. VKM Ac-2851]|uniref:AI-2E family transporter n=1 Tax=Herbiconiux sp. VKM Ac-2851 TaxID=2739025 RepID=UPI001566ED56|nr:AI-2E family transporter [Herbiconiux sp. VKM Ac-2851]NQX33652.1 AI-2E family transporter [Herbiconiux sp. VKM Ac-2851]
MTWWRRTTAAAPVPAAPPEPAVAAGRDPHRAAMMLAGLGGATVTAFGLFAIQSFFAPVFLALILTICVHPLRRALERRGTPSGIATGTVIAAVFLLLAGFVTALVVAFAQFAALLPQYAPQIEAVGQGVAEALSSAGLDPQQVQSVVADFDPGRLIAFAGGILGSVTNITFGLVIILTTLILMAMDATFVPTLFRQVDAERPAMITALRSFAVGVRRYMIATTGLGVAQGLLNWVALLILQVPGALLWGLLAFLCSFIPNIGYFIAIIPPLIFGYFTGGWPTVIAVVVVYGVINAVVQSIIQPRVVGNAVALSQTITFASVLFWAVVIGPIGAILAIPLTLLVRTLLIDSDPAAQWWRPVIGDFSETKVLMKTETETARRIRHDHRHPR